MTGEETGFESGGSRCAATLYRPGSTTGPVPCVVMGPGITLTRGDGIPDYAARLAAAGLAALAFDHRHWGDSEGEPRRHVSIRRQLADWRAAVACARGIAGVDADRIVVWGMSLGGGHALATAAADPRIAAVVALVPFTDGRAQVLASPLAVTLRLTGRGLAGAVTGGAWTVPVAGPPGATAVIGAPEALAGFERLASATGWRNEVNASLPLAIAWYRPRRRAARIAAPTLLQLGEDDRVVPRAPIAATAARAGDADLRCYPIDHFGCFHPDHLDRIAGDQTAFLHRHLPGPGRSAPAP
jgi:dienelactone hydrolase